MSFEVLFFSSDKHLCIECHEYEWVAISLLPPGVAWDGVCRHITQDWGSVTYTVLKSEKSRTDSNQKACWRTENGCSGSNSRRWSMIEYMYGERDQKNILQLHRHCFGTPRCDEFSAVRTEWIVLVQLPLNCWYCMRSSNRRRGWHSCLCNDVASSHSLLNGMVKWLTRFISSTHSGQKFCLLSLFNLLVDLECRLYWIQHERWLTSDVNSTSTWKSCRFDAEHSRWWLSPGVLMSSAYVSFVLAVEDELHKANKQKLF